MSNVIFLDVGEIMKYTLGTCPRWHIHTQSVTLNISMALGFKPIEGHSPVAVKAAKVLYNTNISRGQTGGGKVLRSSGNLKINEHPPPRLLGT